MDDDAGFEKSVQLNGIGHQSHSDANFGATYVFDLELVGGASIVTVYEDGAPRFKKSMAYADFERLLGYLPASSLCLLPKRP